MEGYLSHNKVLEPKPSALFVLVVSSDSTSTIYDHTSTLAKAVQSDCPPCIFSSDHGLAPFDTDREKLLIRLVFPRYSRLPQGHVLKHVTVVQRTWA